VIRRTCAGTAACLAAALLLVGCAPTALRGGNGTASSARISSTPASSGSQDLRVSIDLALGAHVMLLARTTDAALGVRTSEFSTYGTALHDDDATVAGAVVPGNDPQTGDSVANALTVFDKAVLDYTTAVYTKNSAMQQQASTDMTTTYVPQMRSALTAATHAPVATLTAGLTQQVADAQALIGAQAAGSWTVAYQALATAYTHQVAFGTSLTLALARTDPRGYPGNPLAGAATLRDTVESQLQQQAYLLGMAESAGAGGRTAEQQAAAAAYLSSTSSLSDAISPAGSRLASGVSGSLTQALAAAAALATATAQHDAGGVSAQQEALKQTFPAGYVTLVHGTLGITQRQATASSSAFGQALANQAAAEGQQQGSPQLEATAALTGAKLGRQLSVAVATRYGAAFPT
jgi:hypothetical protein